MYTKSICYLVHIRIIFQCIGSQQIFLNLEFQERKIDVKSGIIIHEVKSKIKQLYQKTVKNENYCNMNEFYAELIRTFISFFGIKIFPRITKHN